MLVFFVFIWLAFLFLIFVPVDFIYSFSLLFVITRKSNDAIIIFLASWFNCERVNGFYYYIYIPHFDKFNQIKEYMDQSIRLLFFPSTLLFYEWNYIWWTNSVKLPSSRSPFLFHILYQDLLIFHLYWHVLSSFISMYLCWQSNGCKFFFCGELCSNQLRKKTFESISFNANDDIYMFDFIIIILLLVFNVHSIYFEMKTKIYHSDFYDDFQKQQLKQLLDQFQAENRRNILN